MKKTMLLTMLAITVVMFGAAQAHAVPVANGAINPAGEWANTGYNYYLQLTDPNEIDIPDAYDIKNVVLLQEIEGFGYGDGNAANDGIYLLVETFLPPSLVETTPGGTTVTIYLDGDFGNGPLPIGPGFDFTMEHSADAAGNNQAVTITFNVFGVTGDLVANGGAFGVGSVLEYYIPSGPFNTPHIPFPAKFMGMITYDNGGRPADDDVVGQLPVIPEPASMFLLGSGLLGLFGFKRFGK